MTISKRLDARPATAADIRDYYGEPAPTTLRAWVLEREGEVVGVGGYYLVAGTKVVFSDIRPGMPKMLIYRAALELMRIIRPPAVCQATETSGPFLERLGWEHVTGSVYAWQHSSPH